MWHISKISNSRHEVTIQHKDGTEHSFVIPEEHRESSKARGAFVRTMMDRRTVIKKAEDAKEIKALERATHPFPWQAVLLAIQTAAILALLFVRLK